MVVVSMPARWGLIPQWGATYWSLLGSPVIGSAYGWEPGSLNCYGIVAGALSWQQLAPAVL